MSVASHLGAIIQQSRLYHGAHDREGPPSGEIRLAALDCQRRHGTDYGEVRYDLLDFCLQSGLDPIWIGHAVDDVHIADTRPGSSWPMAFAAMVPCATSTLPGDLSGDNWVLVTSLLPALLELTRLHQRQFLPQPPSTDVARNLTLWRV